VGRVCIVTKRSSGATGCLLSAVTRLVLGRAAGGLAHNSVEQPRGLPQPACPSPRATVLCEWPCCTRQVSERGSAGGEGMHACSHHHGKGQGTHCSSVCTLGLAFIVSLSCTFMYSPGEYCTKGKSMLYPSSLDCTSSQPSIRAHTLYDSTRIYPRFLVQGLSPQKKPSNPVILSHELRKT